jgi:ParB family chromosome partitioning protein
LQIVSIPAEALVRYDRNARVHPDHQIALLQRSLSRYGWCAPVLVDEDNVIVAGHGRLDAALNLWRSGIAIRDCDPMQVPCVRLSGLSAAQIRALRIADNKIAQLSFFDEAELADALRSIGQANVIGFTDEEFARLTGTLAGDDASRAAGSPDETGTGADLVEFSCMVSDEQRDQINDILRGGMQRFNVPTIGDALVEYCRRALR